MFDREDSHKHVSRLFNDLKVEHALQDTAAAWYDGAKSAMNSFALGRPFSPAKLVRETKQTLNGLTDDFRAKHEPRLKALLEAAELMDAHMKAVQAAEKALFNAYALGVDPYELRLAVERGEARGTRSRKDRLQNQQQAQ